MAVRVLGPSLVGRVVTGSLLALVLASIVSAQSATGTSSAGLFFEVSGSGDPVVFIHAFSVDRRMWEPQISVFQGRYRVIRYDLRGHGRSAPIAEPYFAYEDLRSVFDALDVRRATLVGLSAGTEVATDFALTYPDRVVRLVLASPGLGGYAVPPLPWAAPPFQAAAMGDLERATRLWAETPIMALRNNLAAASEVKSLVTSNSRLWTYQRAEQRLSPPAIKRLSEIKCPVLIIVGDEDLPHIKDIGSVLVRGMPGATLATVPRAGHLVNMDAPQQFNDIVSTFLSAKQ